jgi:hypothetical protein
MTAYVLACAVENITPDGTCAVPVWVQQPQPVLPPLTLAEGALVAFSIGSVWALGAWYRFIKRATAV